VVLLLSLFLLLLRLKDVSIALLLDRQMQLILLPSLMMMIVSAGFLILFSMASVIVHCFIVTVFAGNLLVGILVDGLELRLLLLLELLRLRRLRLLM
jgi:hypothetical protein